MKALVFKNKVIELHVEEFPTHPSLKWIDCDETIEVGAVYENGEFVVSTEPEPTEEELISVIESKILREQAEARLAVMTDKEKRALLEEDK